MRNKFKQNSKDVLMKTIIRKGMKNMDHGHILFVTEEGICCPASVGGTKKNLDIRSTVC